MQFKGSRLGFAECPAYFEELAANRPIVASHVLTHPATSVLAENYLKPLGISSLLDAPVWECGEGVGVLRHEHIGPARAWSPEEVDFVSALASMVSLALEESNRARSEHLLRVSEARLRESEARFSTAFRASPALISLLRLSDGKFVEVNDAFARWLGLDRDSIVGHSTKELVIEDEPEMRRNLTTILRLEKFHPLPAENGRVGVALAKKEKPDLILCDVMMPELDGYGVIAALRADPETVSIPFIFLTAKGEKPDIRAGMNLGADDYLTKPVAKPDLLAAIYSRLERAVE